MTGNTQRTDVYTPYVQLPAKDLMMLKQPTNGLEKRGNSFLVEPSNNNWLVVANYPEAGSPSWRVTSFRSGLDSPLDNYVVWLK